MVAGSPRAESAVPAAVLAALEAAAAVGGGRSLRAVWENELGGLTYEVGVGAARQFVKWTPVGSGIDLGQEAARLTWAGRYTPVPQVLGQGADEEGSWIITAGLPGENAVTARWKADPARAVAAIGQALRSFHDALPVDECPFSWSVEDRLAKVRRRATAGQVDPAGWHEDHDGLGLEQALKLLADPPPPEQLVVCHGDTCAPNTLLTEDGRWSGHVDLGALGLADRWADLAIATWSTTWNYGPGWEDPLLAAYGITADPDRTRYYRLLWDLGS